MTLSHQFNWPNWKPCAGTTVALDTLSGRDCAGILPHDCGSNNRKAPECSKCFSGNVPGRVLEVNDAKLSGGNGARPQLYPKCHHHGLRGAQSKIPIPPNIGIFP